MVMDTTKEGFVGRLTITVSVGVSVLALLGGVYSIASGITELSNKVDRNCRVLAIIQGNTRFLILEHTKDQRDAKNLQEIFKAAAIEACGS